MSATVELLTDLERFLQHAGFLVGKLAALLDLGVKTVDDFRLFSRLWKRRNWRDWGTNGKL